ncbi:MAG: NAD(P)-dependent oxidoreductase [Rhodospirillaceae bacterium]|nr:NAD(P)-dependent oxidoreductase [Rhodospirillaceae bacterium]
MNAAKPRLGYIGIGLMGAPMTGRLLDAGYDVSIWNRSADKIKPLVAKGAKAAASPRAVAEAADIVMMCLTAAPAVRDVVFGANGIAEAKGPAKYLVDFSSMRPDLTREWAAELRQKNGMGWVDSPVSGGVPGAEKGTLAIMAGGAPEDFAAVKDVVAHLSSRYTLMGPSGAGQTTKLVNQIIVSTTIVTLAEAFAFAERAGVDAARLPEAMKGGWADSLPLQIFGPRFAKGQIEPKLGDLAIMVKDLDTVADVARGVNAPLPMNGAAFALLRTMMAHGHGQDCLTSVCKLYGSDRLF